MDDLKVLPFQQRLSVLNNLFTTCPESGRVQYGERGVHRELPSCFHTSAQSILDTPLLNLRFTDSGGDSPLHRHDGIFHSSITNVHYGNSLLSKDRVQSCFGTSSTVTVVELRILTHGRFTPELVESLIQGVIAYPMCIP